MRILYFQRIAVLSNNCELGADLASSDCGSRPSSGRSRNLTTLESHGVFTTLIGTPTYFAGVKPGSATDSYGAFAREDSQIRRSDPSRSLPNHFQINDLSYPVWTTIHQVTDTNDLKADRGQARSFGQQIRFFFSE